MAKRPAFVHPVTDILGRLVAAHEGLTAQLRQHQLYLVAGEVEPSGQAWQEFACNLLRHMRAEEDVVLPRYAAEVSPRQGAGVDVFRREHQRLRRFVTELDAWLQLWQGRRPPAAEIILLVERQKTLKEVLEHHDERERTALYPDLESALGGASSADLLAAFTAAEEQPLPLPERPAAGDPAIRHAASLATAWLQPLYREVLAGVRRPRRPAPWSEGEAECRRLHEALDTTLHGLALRSALDDLVALLETSTPLNAFPAARAVDAHACWHLAAAARRAAAPEAGDD